MDKTKFTTVTLKRETQTRLNKLKYKFGCESLDEVIDRLLKILTKFKMAAEFKNI